MTPAVGRGLCPARPALPTAFFCLRVFAHPNVPSVTTTTAAETVSVSLCTFTGPKIQKKKGKSAVGPVKVILACMGDSWCNYVLPLFRAALTLSLTFLYSSACDSQCLTCDTAGACTSCRDPSRVLLFGECQYDSCAHQYYLNTTTRTCRGTPPCMQTVMQCREETREARE